jgi:hypothetical protein
MALAPHSAMAWGPGAHIETSIFILSHLALLTPALRKLISTFPHHFIYGSVCPDMVLGKRLMKKHENNHLWAQGHKILYGARTEAEEAFAWGYLSHLAADTIAHNHFVPNQILGQLHSRKHSHMTQELLFDAMLEDSIWKTARIVAQGDFRDCEKLFLKNLPRTPLPKLVNRRVFRSGVFLVEIGGWQRIIRRVRKRWEGVIDEKLMIDYIHRVHLTVLDYLQDPQGAPCLKESPTGGEVLPTALDLRLTLKTLDRQALLPPKLYFQMVSSFRDWREELRVEGTAFVPAPVVIMVAPPESFTD